MTVAFAELRVLTWRVEDITNATCQLRQRAAEEVAAAVLSDWHDSGSQLASIPDPPFPDLVIVSSFEDISIMQDSHSALLCLRHLCSHALID